MVQFQTVASTDIPNLQPDGTANAIDSRQLTSRKVLGSRVSPQNVGLCDYEGRAISDLASEKSMCNGGARQGGCSTLALGGTRGLASQKLGCFRILWIIS